MSNRFKTRDTILLVVLAVASVAAFAWRQAKLQSEAVLAAHSDALQHQRGVENERRGSLVSALRRAGMQGDVTTFENLINKVDKTSAFIAVQEAVQHGQTTILKRWYEKGWPPVVSTGQSRSTAWIIDATCSQNPQTVQFLLGKGADVNVNRGKGMTPLAFASSRANTDVVKLLLNAGADVNAPDVGGLASNVEKYSDGSLNITQWTPLMFASRSGNAEVVQLLLAHHALITPKSGRGQTALSLAKQFNHLEVVKILEQSGAQE